MSQPLLKDRIPQPELLEPGHLACPGCGGALALRLVLKGLGEKAIVVLSSSSCALLAGRGPRWSLRVPLVRTVGGAAAAAGIRAALSLRGDDDTTVVAWAGSGGALDVGLPSLLGAAGRGDDILYCCYDDGAVLDVGSRSGSAGASGDRAAGAPAGSPVPPRAPDLLAILAAQAIPYAATACVAFPDDLLDKVRRAQAARGTRFLQILAPCPPGWEAAEARTVELGRLAVHCRAFPLVEVEDGERWRLTREPAGTPVHEYLRRQGRFRHLGDADLERAQQRVDSRWRTLERRIRMSAGA